MEIKKFEDIIAWQKARKLVRKVYEITKKETFSKDYGLKDQIQRAAVSVMSNIAEGYERGTKEELIQFLYIARGSCGEVRAQLYVAYDQKYISDKEFHELQKLAVEVSRLIYHFIEYLKGAGIKGQKYKKRVKSFKTEVDEFLKTYFSSQISSTPETFETPATPETFGTPAPPKTNEDENAVSDET
ncbi:MAG: four helix bundle protein [Endomicrobiia bacterium]